MNDSNTHSAFIAGKGFSVFIDGIPDKCDHDYSGPGVHFVSGGENGDEVLTDAELAKSPGATESEKFYNKDQELRKQGKWISGGAVTCAKCGKIFSPPMF
jgi:hypothetical protein